MRWSRPNRRARRDLVDGVDAFLAGRLAEHLYERGDRVPAWCWTNLLAHGTEQELRDAPVIRQPHPFGQAEAWSRARAYVAGEVVDLAQAFGGLAQVQEQVLQPLERDLSLRTGRLRPEQWATLVVGSLAEGAARRPRVSGDRDGASGADRS